MDASDPLASYRKKFLVPAGKKGKNCIYLCGHSLGLQPTTAGEYIKQELNDWAALGVEGHFHARHPWVPYHELMNPQVARLAGAEPGEVVVMNSLTVNLHLAMVSFYRPDPSRNKILVEANAFPSDRYAVRSQMALHGIDPAHSLIEASPREGETTLRVEDVESLIDREGKDIALILMGGVQYFTGQAFDMERIVRAGHAKGCVVGFDLAHAIGNIPLRLHDWGVDFAVWCSYKYLNGGPGSLAGLFIHERHVRNQKLPRLAGWWGHDKATRFEMPAEFVPIPTAEGWQLSNPPILSAAALRASLDVFDTVGMERLREKSEQLTGYLEYLLGRSHKNFVIITPRETRDRGAQLSLLFRNAGQDTFQRLTAADVVCDWREADMRSGHGGVIRVAPVPLYNSFTDVFRFAQVLADGS